MQDCSIVTKITKRQLFSIEVSGFLLCFYWYGEVIEDRTDLDRSKVARDGDHSMSPFPCDLCHFQDICKRDPIPGIHEGDLLALWFF